MFSSDFNPELPQRLRAAGDHPPAPARHSVPLLLLWPANTRLLHPPTHRPGRGTGCPVILPAGTAGLPHRKLRSLLLSSELHWVNIQYSLRGQTTPQTISKQPLLSPIDIWHFCFAFQSLFSFGFRLNWGSENFPITNNSNSDPR